MEEATEFEIPDEADSNDQSSAFPSSDKFDEIFAEAVYETLSWTSSFVAPVLHVYLHDAMTHEFGVRRTRLNAKDAKDLEMGLEKIFGFGAKIVEYRILGTLYEKLRLTEGIEQNSKFSNEVERAKKLYESKLRARRRATSQK